MNILNNITTWFMIISSLLIGYFLGSSSLTKENIQKIFKETKRKLKKSKIGAIKTLTAEEKKKRGTKLEEEELEMTKTIEEEIIPKHGQMDR